MSCHLTQLILFWSFWIALLTSSLGNAGCNRINILITPSHAQQSPRWRRADKVCNGFCSYFSWSCFFFFFFSFEIHSFPQWLTIRVTPRRGQKNKREKKVTESMYTRIFTVPSVGSRIHDGGCCFILLNHIFKRFFQLRCINFGKKKLILKCQVMQGKKWLTVAEASELTQEDLCPRLTPGPMFANRSLKHSSCHFRQT